MTDVVMNRVVVAPIAEYLSATENSEFWPISEVSINGPGGAFIEFWGKGYQYVENPRITEEWIKDTITQLARYHRLPFTRAVGIVACRLPGGHRFQGVSGDIYKGSGAISIRVKRPFRASLNDFDVSQIEQTRLRESMEDGDNVLIIGGTSSGKTTLFNCLANFIPLTERIITIEDAEELDLPHKNWVPFVVGRAEVSNDVQGHVINNLVRMNPYRILGGEVSVHNLFGFINALNTGHKGFASTMHANNPLEALEGARMRLKLAGHDPSGCIEFLARTINLIVQVSVCDDGKRRVTDIVRPADLPWRSLVGGEASRASGGHGGNIMLPWFHKAGNNARDRLRARLDDRVYGPIHKMEKDMTALLDPMEVAYLDAKADGELI